MNQWVNESMNQWINEWINEFNGNVQGYDMTISSLNYYRITISSSFRSVIVSLSLSTLPQGDLDYRLVTLIELALANIMPIFHFNQVDLPVVTKSSSDIWFFDFDFLFCFRNIIELIFSPFYLDIWNWESGVFKSSKSMKITSISSKFREAFKNLEKNPYKFIKKPWKILKLSQNIVENP